MILRHRRKTDFPPGGELDDRLLEAGPRQQPVPDRCSLKPSVELERHGASRKTEPKVPLDPSGSDRAGARKTPPLGFEPRSQALDGPCVSTQRPPQACSLSKLTYEGARVASRRRYNCYGFD